MVGRLDADRISTCFTRRDYNLDIDPIWTLIPHKTQTDYKTCRMAVRWSLVAALLSVNVRFPGKQAIRP